VYSELEVNLFSQALGLHNEWDLPAKRSVALAHARERGAAVALLVDDDIWPVTAADLRAFRSLGNKVAGKPPHSAADISATEYATGLYAYHRFPNGNYLYIDPSAEFGFFPAIYNDDWLFIMSSGACQPTLMDGNPIYQVARQIDLRQRSSEQEFGEVFVDGLARMTDPGDRDLSFWNSALELRRTSLAAALPGAPAPTRSVIGSALDALSRFKPPDFRDCDQLWHRSQKAWRRFVGGSEHAQD
jgi:hypothetical protein